MHNRRAARPEAEAAKAAAWEGRAPVAVLAFVSQAACGDLEGHPPVEREVVAQRAQASVRVHPQRLIQNAALRRNSEFLISEGELLHPGGPTRSLPKECNPWGWRIRMWKSAMSTLVARCEWNKPGSF